MSEDDSSSEDLDYKPTTIELQEAEDQHKSKRQKVDNRASAAEKIPQASTKVEDIWQQLSSGPAASKSRSKVSLAAVCRPVNKSSTSSADKEWMRQLGVPNRKAAQSLSGPAQPNVGASHDMDLSYMTLGSSDQRQGTQLGRTLDPGIAAQAIAAAKLATSSTGAQHVGHVAVTETRRFAGKDVQVSKMATAEEAEKHKEKEQGNKAGLDAVLASLEGAKKVNVLDKSRDDWGQFKQADTNIEEELEAYKKSGTKYLDRVNFLKRAELREYEAERDKRNLSKGGT